MRGKGTSNDYIELLDKCDRLIGQRYDLQLQRDKVLGELARIQSVLDGHLKILDAEHGIIPQTEDPERYKKWMQERLPKISKLSDRILVLLHERFEDGMTFQEIYDSILTRWGDAKETSVRQSLSRMKLGGTNRRGSKIRTEGDKPERYFLKSKEVFVKPSPKN